MKNFLRIVVILLFAAWQNPVSAQYCTTNLYTTGCSVGDDLDDVTIGNFSQTATGCSTGAYADYTTDTVQVPQTVSTAITITSNFSSQYYALWIDANNDGDFDDAGELLWNSTIASGPSGTATTGTFLIPTSIAQGNYRLRLRAAYNQQMGATNSCTSYTWGEVHDYTIAVLAPPACPAPFALTLNSVSATTATIGWTSTGTSFDIEYGPAGFVLGTGSSTTSTTNSIALTGLTPNTTYDVYVRNDCSGAGNGLSLWSLKLTFTTPCVAVTTFPFNEDFDGSTWVPSTGFAPFPTTIDGCWDRSPIVASFNEFGWVPATGVSYGFNTGPNTDKSGTGQYAFAFSNGGSPLDTAYLTLPQMDLSGLTTPLLTFWHHMFGASMGDLLIQASTNGSTWTTVYTISGQQQTAAADNWIESIVDVTAYKSTTTQIRFVAAKSNNFGGGDMAIDEVSVAEAPPCPKPTAVSISNISSSSAVVNFLSNGVSFPIEWGPAGYIQGTGFQDTATATGYTVNGLPANTAIDLYILNDCSGAGNGLSAWAGPFTFRTLCNAFAEGYFENFDALAANTKEPCWFDLSIGGTSQHTVEARVPSTFSNVQPFSAPNLYYWYNAGAALSLVITPELEGLDGDSTQVKFRMTHNYFNAATSINVWVGTMSDRTDTSTITWVDTIVPAQYTWNQFTILFDNVPAGDKFVVFGRDNTVTFTEVDIDDFLFEGIPACLPPTSHTVVIADLDSISLTWTGGNTALSNIEYGPCGFIQGTGLQLPGGTNGSGTLNNLVSGTCYDIYIQNDCGNGVVSPWYGPIQVSTPVCAVANQCSYKFILEDSFGDGWNGALMDITQNGVVVGTIGSSFTTGNWDTAFVPVCDAFNTSVVVNAQGSWPSEVGFEVIDPFGVPVFSYATGTGITTGQTLTTFMSGCTPPACADPLSLTASNLTGFTADLSWSVIGSNHVEYYIEYGPTGFVQGTGGGTLDTTQTTSITISGLIPVTCYDYYVMGDCGVNGTSAWAGPFNFCTTVSCPAPTNLSLQSAGLNTAALSWTSGSASDWNYVNVPTGQPVSSGTVVQTTSNPTSITGLTAGSAYDFYVRDSCGVGDVSVWTGPITYVTPLCDTAQQCDFTVNMFDSFGDGWNGFEFSIEVNGVVFEQIGSTFTTGSVDSTTFKACNAFPVTVKVISAGSWPTEVSFDIKDDQGNTVLSGSNFTATSTGSTVGNFIPNCLPVTCPAPQGLAATNITSTSADLSWTSTATNFEISYGLGSFPVANGTKVVTANNPYALTGLNASSTYSFFVRALCGAGDTSVWNGPFTFSTACGTIATYPYTENFDGPSWTTGAPGTIDQCWTRDQSTTIPRWQVNAGGTSSLSTGPTAANSAPNYLFLETSGGVLGSTSTLELPAFDLTSLTTPLLTFYYHMYGATMGDLKVEVSVDTGATWTTVLTKTGQDQTADTDPFKQDTVNLTAYNTAHTLIRFEGVRGSSFTSDMAIDDIAIADLGGCPAPSNFAASTIACDSVVLAWNSDPGTVLSGVLYGPAGFNPQTGGTAVAPATSPLTINGLTAGTGYDVYLTDSCSAGLSAPQLLSITTPAAPLPTIVFSATQINTTATSADVGFDATGSSNYTSLLWDFGGGNTSTNAVTSFTYSMNQTYSVTLTLTNGCGTADTTFDVTVTGIGLEESLINQTMNVYPNPNSGDFRVEFQVEGLKDVELRVVTLLGQVVYESKPGNVSGTYREEIKLDDAAAGVYIVQLVTSEGTISRRVTVRK